MHEGKDMEGESFESPGRTRIPTAVGKLSRQLTGGDLREELEAKRSMLRWSGSARSDKLSKHSVLQIEKTLFKGKGGKSR